MNGLLTGVRERKNDGFCAICLYDHLPLVSTFACQCAPMCCETCIRNVTHCATCKKGKYRRITREEILRLVDSRCSMKELRKIVIAASKEGYTSPFRFTQLVCHVSDIDEVFKSKNVQVIDFDIIHSIYCLAVDFWKIDHEKLRSPVICYKGYFPDVGHVTSYSEICHYRRLKDKLELMSNVFEFDFS